MISNWFTLVFVISSIIVKGLPTNPNPPTMILEPFLIKLAASLLEMILFKEPFPPFSSIY
jgi:hypothetical protein